MGTQIASELSIRTKEEVRQTIQESFLIDRGFFSNRLTIIVTLAALALWLIAPIWSMVPVGLLALDYAWFVVRRRKVLRHYDVGTPRLETPADFQAVAQAFADRGLAEPNMTDWHEAAGFGGAPQWRGETFQDKHETFIPVRLIEVAEAVMHEYNKDNYRRETTPTKMCSTARRCRG